MALAGLRLRDASGNVTLDTTTRSGILTGSRYITSAGAQPDPALANGVPFYMFVPDQYNPVPPPLVTFSGTTVSWQSQGAAFSGTLFWGTY